MRKNFEFIKPIIEKTSPDILKRFQETGEIRNKGNLSLDKLDLYNLAVFDKAAAIIGEIERLENASVFIQNFRNPRAFEKLGIHHVSWLEYHYSYFIVTYHSLFDISLILTNAVFQLGIPEKDCKASIINDNEWVKRTPVKTALDGIRKIVSNYGQTRNLFVHRGILPDIRSITDSDMIDIINLYCTINQHSAPIMPLEMIDKVFSFECKKISIRLEGDIVIAQEAVYRLYDSLLPIYIKRAK